MSKLYFNLIRIWPEKPLFWGRSWFKFSDLRLAVGMTLKFCTSVAKSLSQRDLGGSSYVCRSSRGQTGRGRLFLLSLPTSSWMGLIVYLSLLLWLWCWLWVGMYCWNAYSFMSNPFCFISQLIFSFFNITTVIPAQFAFLFAILEKILSLIAV